MRSRMSASESIATPTLPTSPSRGVVRVVAHLGRQVEGTRQAGLPGVEQELEALVGRLAEPKPAYWRMVHNFRRYIPGWTPRV